jgi:hypothetical protein
MGSNDRRLWNARPDYESGWVEAGNGAPPREWIVNAVEPGDSFLLSDSDTGLVEVWSHGKLEGLFRGQLFAQRCYDRVHYRGQPGELVDMEYHVVGPEHEVSDIVANSLRALRANALVRDLGPGAGSAPWHVWFAGEWISSCRGVESAKLALARRLHHRPSEDAFEDNMDELLARFARRITVTTNGTDEWVTLFDAIQVRRERGGFGVRDPRLHPQADWDATEESAARSAWWYAFNSHVGDWHDIHDVLDMTWEW